MGLGVSLAIIFLIEFLSPRIDHEYQLKDLVPAPLLTTIPGLWTPKEERAIRRTRIWQAVSATALFIVVASVTVLVYYFG